MTQRIEAPLDIADNSTYHVEDEGDLRKYRTEIPNLVDDLGLSVYAFRLYVHFKRVCGARGGVCHQGTRTMAKACKMSLAKIVDAKRELIQAELITLKTFPRSENKPDEVRIRDIWLRNFQMFAPCSPDEHPCSDYEHPCSPDEQKNKPFKKEPFKKLGKPKEKEAARRQEGYSWLFTDG